MGCGDRRKVWHARRSPSRSAVLAGLVLVGCGSAPEAARPGVARASSQGPDQDRAGATCGARVRRAVSLLAAGETREAERQLRAAARITPSCSAAHVDLAIVLRRTDRPAEALQCARRALAADTGNVDALEQVALAHLAMAEEDIGSLALAELACRQALALDPRRASLHNTLGVVRVNQGRVVEAMAAFERAFDLDPDMFEAWMNFAQIALSFRGYEDAERAFRAAVSLQTDAYDALVGLGVALRGLGRHGEALDLYLRARDVSSARPEAWFNLGVLHQDHLSGSAEDLRLAKGYFETFVDHANDDPRFAPQIDEVRRCCPDRGAQARCQPGRLQDIGESLRALTGTAAPRCGAGVQGPRRP